VKLIEFNNRIIIVNVKKAKIKLRQITIMASLKWLKSTLCHTSIISNDPEARNVGDDINICNFWQRFFRLYPSIRAGSYGGARFL